MEKFDLNSADSRGCYVEIILAGNKATSDILDALYRENDVIQGLITPVNKWAQKCSESGDWPLKVQKNGKVEPYGLTSAKIHATLKQKKFTTVATCINQMIQDRNNALKEKTSVKGSIGSGSTATPVVTPVMKVESGDSIASLIQFAEDNHISDKAKLALFGF